MKRWFLVAAITVLVLNLGWLVYSEIKRKQVLASLGTETTETQSHPPVARRYVPQVSSMPESDDSSLSEGFSEQAPELAPESSDELSDELYRMLEDYMYDADEECCPGDDAITDDWDTLSWDEKIRRKLISKHGDIPEIERYIEFESVYRQGGNLTVAEVLEHLELRVMLYDDSHGMLAQQRELASGYSPDDIVTVKRDYNSKPSGKSGTTVTKVVTHR